jgi:hypothetical protein
MIERGTKIALTPVLDFVNHPEIQKILGEKIEKIKKLYYLDRVVPRRSHGRMRP